MRGRGAAMSQKMRQIKAANPGLPQTQVLSMASKQLSGKQSKNGGFLPLLPMALSALGGMVIPKLISAVTGSGMRASNRGRGLMLGRGMYMKPFR